MAWTQQQLDKIKDSYALGVLEAMLPDGSKVRYQSGKEMRLAISDIEREVRASSGQNKTKNVMYPTHSRGFHG